MSAGSNEKTKFILQNLLKGFLAFLPFLVGFIILNRYFSDNLEAWMMPLQDHPFRVYTVFFISELPGLLPPEFFMVWAMKGSWLVYLIQLLIFSALSYLAGTTSFLIGRYANKIPLLRNWLNREGTRNYLSLYRKYGGILILLSAITPIPFGTISLLSGSLRFPLHLYLLYATPRAFRFLGYGWIMWLVQS